MNSDSKTGAAKVHSNYGPQTLFARPEKAALAFELLDEPVKRTVAAGHQRQLDELYSELNWLTTQLAWLKK